MYEYALGFRRAKTLRRVEFETLREILTHFMTNLGKKKKNMPTGTTMTHIFAQSDWEEKTR